MFPNDEVFNVWQIRPGLRTFSTFMEINTTGHQIFCPDSSISLEEHKRMFGSKIGGMMHFLRTKPLDIEDIYLESYSLDVRIRENASWNPRIEHVIKNTFESMSPKIKIANFPGDDTHHTISHEQGSMRCFHSTELQRFCRPLTTYDLTRLGCMRGHWKEFMTRIFRIPGIEEVEPYLNYINVEIANAYSSRWEEHIKPEIKQIMREVINPNIRFVYI